MARFDEFVTDRRIQRAGVQAYLKSDDERPNLRRDWVTATSGSSNQPGPFLFNRSEWAHMLASFARARDYAGLPKGLTHPPGRRSSP
jgi:phenylacetate-CoA ligase